MPKNMIDKTKNNKKKNNKNELIMEGLSHNNLKDLNLTIPHNKVTAIIGPSGSGKSSLAFNSIFAEGRWRYMESLSTYSRMFLDKIDRPKVKKVKNIRPAIAIEQKNHVRNSRSTVATTTELYDHLRVIFAKIGIHTCPNCKKVIKEYSPQLIVKDLEENYEHEKAYVCFKKEITDERYLKELLTKGFIRIKIKDEVIDLSDREDLKDIKGEVLVIVDRLKISKNDTRLMQSLESAFSWGSGRVTIDLPSINKSCNFSKEIMCEECDISIAKATPILFSFNHPLGACEECKGFGNILEYDLEKIIPNRNLSLMDGAIEPWTKPSYKWWNEEMAAFAAKHSLSLTKPYKNLSEIEKNIVLNGTDDFEGIDGFFNYLESKKYKLHIRVFLSRYKGQNLCPKCKGTRLKKETQSILVSNKNITDITKMTVKDCLAFFTNIDLSEKDREISKEALQQIIQKLEFLSKTGLDYLTLDRQTKTLSGGESQRVNLATQLSSNLTGVLYILDEPSIGLHQKDIDMVTNHIEHLSSLNNTVIIVEHDPYVIAKADHILELGPGSGTNGGNLVYQGTTKDFLKDNSTLTSKYMTGEKEINPPRWRRKGNGKSIILKGARGNNLKNVTIEIPLKTISCISGVSGSGKSSLIIDTLYRALAKSLAIKAEKPLEYDELIGSDNIENIILIDQNTIGKTPRSNPVTYIGGFDDIRQFFAKLPDSKKAKSVNAGTFSFNVEGGRCDECEGSGVKTIEMHFLPDVHIPCPKCEGTRYKDFILSIDYKGKNISQVLNLTFDEAQNYFPATLKNLHQKIQILKDVGLGYLKLGQPTTDLSGGEAQRLKISRELISKKEDNTLYILDEPTTGLHPEDVKKLLTVLGRLVDSGNTVVIIEHHLDCIKTADHVIDIGPDGGEKGGTITAFGQPEDIAKNKKSHTGKYLKKIL